MWASSRLFHLYFDNFIWAGRRRGSGLRRGRNYSCGSVKFRCFILIKPFKSLDYVTFHSIITQWLNFTSSIKCRNDNFFELGLWLGCWCFRLRRWLSFSLGLCCSLGIFGLLFCIFFGNISRIRLVIIGILSIF